MEVVHPRVAGLDVHMKSVTVCARLQQGAQAHTEVRTFQTMTGDIHSMMSWLKAKGITAVAMEATGVYWKPIWNLMEDQFELLLCNPAHMKQVPGRKTDVSDAEWIASLHAHGLLRPSFIPDRDQRDFRDLARMRWKTTCHKTAVSNRIAKVLEDANIKLGSVASDILGVSGRQMLQALVDGRDDPDQLAELAKGRLRKKLGDLRAAMEGRVTDHHRFMLRFYLNQLNNLEADIAELSERIRLLLEQNHEKVRGETPAGEQGDLDNPFEPPPPLTMKEAVVLLTTMPGVNELMGERIIAEIGPDMSVFPTSGNLASWAALASPNNKTAGRQKSGSRGKKKGNAWLRGAMSQAACAGAVKKGSYIKARHNRLVSRIGRPKAVVALAHAMLRWIHHMLRWHAPWDDKGGDYFDKRDRTKIKTKLVKRLESMGYTVQIGETAATQEPAFS